MRIATNKFSDLALFFHRELDGIYGHSETEALLAAATSHFLGWSRSELISKRQQRINQSDVLLLYDCAKELALGRPLQYILGECWFMGLRLKVNPSVLIPRPETEELTDRIVKENLQARSFLDIGTGSGCIPVALKHSLPAATVKACDISPEALAVAAANAAAQHCAVDFFRADARDVAQLVQAAAPAAEVIVSNPPYILASEKEAMHPQVIDHEPDLALFVNGHDSILFYRRIVAACETLLLPGGRLYFELNPLTSTEVENCARTSGLFSDINLLKDLSGKIRFLKAVRN